MHRYGFGAAALKTTQRRNEPIIMTPFAFILISLMPLWAGIVAVIFWFTIGRRLADKERAARERSIQHSRT
jgi:hypothetical protein